MAETESESRPLRLERTYSKADPLDLRNLPPSERGEYLEGVQENVLDQMHRADESHLRFVCDYDLDRLLDKHQGILFAFEDWTQDQIDTILKFCPQVFATLLMSSAFTFIRSIRDIFYKRGDTPLAAPLLTDDDLWIKDRPERDSNTTRAQAEFLRKLPFDVKNNFLTKQYEFKPYKIKEPNPNVPLRVEAKARLPFKVQEDNIGVGGYGNVSQVVVAHKYFVRADRTVFEEDERCALKRIEVKDNFLEEVQTLSILKESWTKHARVLRHHVSFTHGKTFNILLELAKHGNLEILLSEGFDPSYGTQKYQVHEEFPMYSPQNPKSMADLINQFYSIADAVKFLHTGFTVGEQHVYLIHMDLKPSNILIMEDTATWDASSVGKWMLSDFGISATKNIQSTNEKSYIYTIGDAASKYDSHNTDMSRTHARRPEGTYQAPEVRADGDETVGKKSDVWSLACIFSEVLAFGLGGSDYVEKFQRQRKGKRRDDYFYAEATQTFQGSLAPPGEGQRTYQVRTSVLQYMESLLADHPEDWVQCCVRIVLNSLVCSMDERPHAEFFKEQIEHALTHYNNPSTNGGESCWVVNRVATGSSRGTSPHDQQSLIEPIRSETPPSSSGGKSEMVMRPPPLRGDQMKFVDGAVLSESPSWGSGGKSEMALRPPPSREDPPRSIEKATSPISQKSPSPSLPNRFDAIFRPATHRRRSSTDNASVTSQNGTAKFSDGPSKFVDACICPSATNAVWLFDAFLYYADLQSLVRNGARPQQQQIIPLSKEIEWSQVDSIGTIIGVRGKEKTSTKQTILIYDLSDPQQPVQIPETPYISHVSNIAISSSGLVVLTCMRRLLLYALSRNTQQGYDQPLLKLTSLPDLSNHDYRFTNVAFSSSGDTVVTWSFGSSNRVAISYWRFDADFRVVAQHSFSVQPFSNRICSLLVAPTPQATLDVMVRELDDSFFTARLGATNARDLPRKGARLRGPGVMVACALHGADHLVVLSHGRVATKTYQVHVYPLLAGGTKVDRDAIKEATVSAKERDYACAMQVLPDTEQEEGVLRVVVLLQDGSSRVHRLYI